jgi:hypothetical protein
VIRVNISRIIKLAGLVAGRNEKCIRNLVGNPEPKTPVRRPKKIGG